MVAHFSDNKETLVGAADLHNLLWWLLANFPMLAC